MDETDDEMTGAPFASTPEDGSGEYEEPDATRDMAACLAPLGKALATVAAEHGRDETWHLIMAAQLHLAGMVAGDARTGTPEYAAARRVLMRLDEEDAADAG